VGTSDDPIASAGALDPHALCLRDAAERAGIATEARLVARPGRHPAPWLVLRVGGGSWHFRAGVLLRGTVDGPPRHINGRAANVTIDKLATKHVLAAAGIAVPRGRVFASDGGYGALAYAAGLGLPVCVKPNRGRKGILAFPGCAGFDRVARAFERVAARRDEILVEESVAGEVVRFFYVRPRVVALKISRPANVVGDGVRTIEALIAAKNLERERRALPGHNPIVIDRDLRAHLAARDLSLSSVPAAGERMLLRTVSNGAAGADSIECADSTHPSYARQAERACEALPGIRISAVDMIVADRSVPAAAGNHWVLELNSSPGLLPYHHPWEGAPQDVAGAILRHLADLR
jgi:D-alanine-D-alanine ligase-like ATP-grasp enzyme